MTPLSIAEQLLQVGDMMMNALIVRPPAMCFRLCLESQDKRILGEVTNCGLKGLKVVG
jgi:hypothetical protein